MQDCTACVDQVQNFRTFLLFPGQHITKNCQQDISVVGEGFVETPGYPQFNVERNCTWKLRVQEGQRVQVSVLDISLRGNYRNHTARGQQRAHNSCV
jgi:hypothetical protein